ncbi:hypothetical protein AMTRI_Chr13g122560 [Amborella trichopoda]
MGEDTGTKTRPEPHKWINWASDLPEIKRNSGDGSLISGNFRLFEEIENGQKGSVNSHFSGKFLRFDARIFRTPTFVTSVNQNASFSSEIPVLFLVIKEGHVPSMSQNQNGGQLVLFNHTPLWRERQENEFFRQNSGDQQIPPQVKQKDKIKIKIPSGKHEVGPVPLKVAFPDLFRVVSEPNMLIERNRRTFDDVTMPAQKVIHLFKLLIKSSLSVTKEG